MLNFLGWCAAFVALLACGVLGSFIVFYRHYERRAATFDLTKIDNLPQRSVIYDANGEIYSYFGGENRLVVPLNAVSKHFIDALLAREDSRFWEHPGIDYQGVLRAIVADLRAGKKEQGASTITQQLARNACELHEHTFDRKVLEAVLARRIEKVYSKSQILEFYVNRIFFGSGFYGIETAARGYFDKPASELTLGEAAVLAALIRSPQRLSPNHNLAAATKERDTVLDRMLELKFISPDEATTAKAQQLQLSSRSSVRASDDDITEAVLNQLSTLLEPKAIEYGGLAVFTSIDPQLQHLAEDAADRKLTEIEAQKGYPHPKKKDFKPETNADGQEKQTNYLQAAVAIVENRTGAIRAIVGGRDHSQSKYSRALLSKRQVGSTFKPFVYATAFEHGMMPGTMVDDSKISPGEFRDLPKKWSPDNSDNEYGGLQPASFGLIKSRNTMSVRVGEFAGLPKVRESARAAGVADEIPDLPVVFLGGFETTVKDLTAAYTAFPNLGVVHSPSLISSVEGRGGHVLWAAPRTEKRVFSPQTSWMVTSILEEVMKSGTAAKAASLGWKKPGAGKTGTTNEFFDAWFVGYTSSLTCGVWVGMDKPQTILEKGYGAALALPIWVEIMQHAPENIYPAAPLQPPEQLVKVTLCSVSGERATSVCAAQHYAYEAELPASRVPRGTCQTHPEPTPAQWIATAPPASSSIPVVPSASNSSPPSTLPASAPTRGFPSVPPADTPLAPTAAAPLPTAPSLPPATPAPLKPAATGSVAQQRPSPHILEDPTSEPWDRSGEDDATAHAPISHIAPPAPSPIAAASEPRVSATRRLPAPPPPAMNRSAPPPDTSAVPQESRRIIPSPSPRVTRDDDDETLPHARVVETRRALPAEPTPQRSEPGETVTNPAPNVTERRTVERTEDGRLRTTVVRTVRGTPDSQSQPAQQPPPQAVPEHKGLFRHKLFGNHDDD